MMKWWELFPTRYTSNMLFRPCVKSAEEAIRKGTVAEAQTQMEKQRPLESEPGAAVVGAVDEVLGQSRAFPVQFRDSMTCPCLGPLETSSGSLCLPCAVGCPQCPLQVVWFTFHLLLPFSAPVTPAAEGPASCTTEQRERRRRRREDSRGVEGREAVKRPQQARAGEDTRDADAVLPLLLWNVSIRENTGLLTCEMGITQRLSGNVNCQGPHTVASCRGALDPRLSTGWLPLSHVLPCPGGPSPSFQGCGCLTQVQVFLIILTRAVAHRAPQMPPDSPHSKHVT